MGGVGFQFVVPPLARGGSGGIGNVVGPASATDNAVVRYDGATGKLIKNSNAILDNTGNLTLAGNVTAQNGFFQNTTPSTGKTLLTVQSGQGQGASSLFRILDIGGGSLLDVDSSGFVVINDALSIGSTSPIFWNGRSVLLSPVNGNIMMSNNSETNFGLLQFGGATSLFPALKRSTTILQARLSDDSAFASIQGKLTTDVPAVTGLVAGVLSALTNASLSIADASGQVYRVPCII